MTTSDLEWIDSHGWFKKNDLTLSSALEDLFYEYDNIFVFSVTKILELPSEIFDFFDTIPGATFAELTVKDGYDSWISGRVATDVTIDKLNAIMSSSKKKSTGFYTRSANDYAEAVLLLPFEDRHIFIDGISYDNYQNYIFHQNPYISTDKLGVGTPDYDTFREWVQKKGKAVIKNKVTVNDDGDVRIDILGFENEERKFKFMFLKDDRGTIIKHDEKEIATMSYKLRDLRKELHQLKTKIGISENYVNEVLQHFPDLLVT